MSTRALVPLRLTAAAAAWSALAVAGLASATAAPTADDQGYIDSTARCTSPSEAVVFGSTETSRVAICASDGEYEYRGVRLRDGARLIVPASKTTDGYTAENDGITYRVTADSLIVSAGTRVIRDETMIDFHTSGAVRRRRVTGRGITVVNADNAVAAASACRGRRRRQLTSGPTTTRVSLR